MDILLAGKKLMVILVSVLLLFEGGCTVSDSTPAKNAVGITPLDRLAEGNARFAAYRPEHPDADRKHLAEVASQQHPFAAIVCCADSRVSPELLFDQGMGDLFVIRTAGNMIGPLELGSIEYAVAHLGVPLVVVMGHEDCGAIKAYLEGGDAPGHIRDIVDSITQEAEIKALPLTNANRVDDCVMANVRHALRQLQTQSGITQEKMKKGELVIAGALYDLHNLKASFFKP